MKRRPATAGENASPQPSDPFNAGVQAGLRTAAELLIELAGRVQKPAPERPGPRGGAVRRGAVAHLVAILGVGASLPASADTTVTHLLAAVTSPGASSAVTTANETGGEQYLFAFRATGNGEAKMQVSLDNGVSWVDLHRFYGRSEFWRYPVCGGCRFRAFAVTASATSTVTVDAAVAGAASLITP